MSLDPNMIRPNFPALQRQVNGQPVIYLDGPGGTQVPSSVIDAMARYLSRGSSNLGGPFLVSREADEVVAQARQAMATMLNAAPNEISFGQNMTSVTLNFSRALAQTWQAGDQIIVTRLDHDANISPWLVAARDRGVTVRWLDFDPVDCTLRLDQLANLLNDKTRLAAITFASNAVGTVNDIANIAKMVHDAGAQLFVDAVHYAPHGPIDVQALDCDYLACSAYKFYGPHTGVLYGKHALMKEIVAYKVRPAPETAPDKWETGTQSFESLAGVTAAVEYLMWLGDGTTPRERIVSGMSRIKSHEAALSLHFLQRATEVNGLRVAGLTDIERIDERTPTFAVSLDGYSAKALATELGAQGIFAYHGHYYAIEVMSRLGVLESGGLVRLGFVHYNSSAEIDRLIETLQTLAANDTEA